VLVSVEIGTTAATAALVTARAAGAITICNPAPFDAAITSAFGHCDVVVPNELEAEAFGGPAAMHAAGATTVVTTLGANGARLHAAGNEPADHGGCIVDVVDTTGAGDAFCAALAVALADGEPPASAVSFACAAGAFACTALGARAALPTRDQVVQLMARR
jgi:ribokinase